MGDNIIDKIISGPLINGGVYQHYKNRDLYKVTGIRTDKTTGSHDGKVKVDYESMKNNKKYCREINEFLGVVWIHGRVPVERFKFIEKSAA